MADWYIGQKVVCIPNNNITHRGFGNETKPKVGEVYTIRDIRPARVLKNCDVVFHLVEIVNEPRQYKQGFGEIWWGSVCFRPLVDQNQDISIFTEILRSVERMRTVEV